MASSPAADAISMTARWVAGDHAYPASIGLPNASGTTTGTHASPVAAAIAATKPSPPSDIGSWMTTASGTASRTPSAIACAASGAVMDSLYESGAHTTIIWHLRATTLRPHGSSPPKIQGQVA